MEKSYSEPQKKDDLQTQDKSALDKTSTAPVNSSSASPATATPSDKPVSACDVAAQYCPQNISVTSPDLSSKAWEQSKNTAWSATPEGRVAIRAFSRGILGAGAFAAGGMLADKWMKGYSSSSSFGEQKNGLQTLAKGIDSFIGKPIQMGVEALTGSERAGVNAVRFRPTKFMKTENGNTVFGRSLGAETVAVTFDFFCASIGDASGRDLVDLVDPNKKKPWYDKNGDLDIAGTGVKALKTAWRYVSYNGGEDWAVAIPYAYFMKGQRALINHFSPGFKYDFDRSLNGSGLKIDNEHKVKGSYALEGLLDLQSRFTVYNIGTLMYREAYNHVANSFSSDKDKKSASLYGPPGSNEHKGLFEKAGDIGKWMLRSAVKGTIYMTPAVPFFWITRTVQKRNDSPFINPEKGVLEYYKEKDHKIDTLRVSDVRDGKVPQGHEICYGNFNEVENHWRPAHISGSFANPYDRTFEHYNQPGTWVDQGFNKIGQVNQAAVDQVNELGRKFEATHRETSLDFKKALDIPKISDFTNRFANAAIAYTPYMAAKYETARLWDDGKMDMAAERMIDGATRFSWGEFKAGAGEVWNSIMQRPLADPERQAESERRMKIDPSAPVDSRQTQAEQKQNASGMSSWQDRIVSGKADDKKADKLLIDSRPRSHAESEAMKKALVELKPPTSAIH